MIYSPKAKELASKLSRLKPRIYRFSHYLLRHICIEALEQEFLETHALPNWGETYLDDLLNSFRATGVFQSTTSETDIAMFLGIDLQDEADKRWKQAKSLAQDNNFDSPSEITQQKYLQHILITGSPRSGTSHLFNLISANGKFAYFTADSHPYWGMTPSQSHKKFWHDAIRENIDMLLTDSRHLKLDPCLLIPNEGEAIWHQHMPIYHHIKGHDYRLYPNKILPIKPRKSADRTDLLQQEKHVLTTSRWMPVASVINAHMIAMGAHTFLSKSPFCSFRLPQMLCDDPKLKVIHIHRDRDDVAKSFDANKFSFSIRDDPTPLFGTEARDLFVTATREATKDLPPDRYAEVAYKDLRRAPKTELNRLNDQLGLGLRSSLIFPATCYQPR